MIEDTNQLVQSFKRAKRKRQAKALLLVAPLLLFILIMFVAPIGSMLIKSFYHPTVIELIPETAKKLESWDANSGNLPNEEVYKTLTFELQFLRNERLSGKFAEEINRFKPALGSVIKSTARNLARKDLDKVTSYTDYLIQNNKQWAEVDTFYAIQKASEVFTSNYYLVAVDKQVGIDGDIVDRENEVYVKILNKTLFLAFAITFLTIVFGYPLSYYLANTKESLSNLLMILVLLPFWTSLLVRTTSWIVLLQKGGVLNQVLMGIGIIDTPLEILYTQYSTIIAMTHILLPFMILPLYSVMKGIDPSYMRASLSLGSNGFWSFIKVYFPLSLPGLSAGAILVFIVSIGYYITPALVGGVDGQMISNLVAYHMKISNNWELAAALGSVVLIVVLILYWVYDKFVGISNLKLGS